MTTPTEVRWQVSSKDAASNNFPLVIPAKAGIQSYYEALSVIYASYWMPAFAGMTNPNANREVIYGQILRRSSQGARVFVFDRCERPHILVCHEL